MSYGYKVLKYGDEVIDHVGMVGPARGAMLAEAAADDFHSNHDGWECEWPLEFVILREDGSLVGRYEVEREAVPEFYARKVKETT